MIHLFGRPEEVDPLFVMVFVNLHFEALAIELGQKNHHGQIYQYFDYVA